MREILALTLARTREYYRDNGSLFWSFVATPFMVVTLAIAFSSDDTPILRAGFIHFAQEATLPLSGEPTIERIRYDDLDAALRRVQHHQLDILIDGKPNGGYWVNPESNKGKLLERLLRAEYPNIATANLVEGKRVRYVDWVIPGILSMNMMFSGLWGIGYVIVRYRKNGVLKRLQATPIRPWQFLAAQTISRLVIMTCVTMLVYFFCNLFIDFLMTGSYALLILIALLGNMSIISMSLLVAARTANEELANGLLNFISFPMLLLSEMWFSLDSSPDWLVAISQLLPLTHLVSAARSVMLDGAGLLEIAPHLMFLVVSAILFMAMASWMFRWDDSR
ncbi:MAG: ABC transporter permease [bacterium]